MAASNTGGSLLREMLGRSEKSLGSTHRLAKPLLDAAVVSP
jgi:hypothetical protein